MDQPSRPGALARANQYLRKVQFRPRYTGTELDTGELRLRYFIGI